MFNKIIARLTEFVQQYPILAYADAAIVTSLIAYMVLT